jgi:hypothetical protein
VRQVQVDPVGAQPLQAGLDLGIRLNWRSTAPEL